MGIVFSWWSLQVELEVTFPKSLLNFYQIHSWAIVSLACQLITNCWENFFSWRRNLRPIYRQFVVRLVTSSFCSCFFLFDVKLWGAYCRKEKANLAQFPLCQIAFITLFADPVPSLFNFIIIQQQIFSIAATMWHSALFLITLLFSCEQGLFIFTGQERWVKCDFSSILRAFIALLRGLKQIFFIGRFTWLQIWA